MPEIQGSYDDGIGQAQVGVLANSALSDVASRQIEGGEIPFGRVVSQGAADRGVVIGGADAIGITTVDRTILTEHFQVGNTAPIMRKGSIWVLTTEAVTPSDTVSFDPATGEINASGTELANARFETTAAAGELVQVHLS